MNCESALEDIPLYLHGELPGSEEEEFEAHVHGCTACHGELNLQKAMLRSLDHYELKPSEALLAECRRDLLRTVAAKEGRRPLPAGGWLAVRWVTWRETLSRMSRPIGALALVALGFLAARLTTRDSLRDGVANLAGLSADPVVSTVRSVQPESSGRVQIAIDETRRRLVTGSVGDDQIRRLLLAAVRDEANAGMRVETVELLKARAGTSEVRDALLHALMKDPNPGVRLKALEGLKGMASQPEVRKTLTYVLQNDDNPGLRIQAIDLLVAQHDGDLVGVLQSLVDKESNNYVRMRCRSALEEMNASIGTF